MASITFLAGTDCDVQVSAAFEADKSSGGDFGSSGMYRLVVIRTASDGSSITVAGTYKGIALARAKYSDLLTSPVLQGETVVAALGIFVGTVTTHLYNIDLRVEVIKR
jgi:hypothetical protein